MKNRTTLVAALLLALIGMFAICPKAANAATAPTKVWVEPSASNGIPAEIDVFRAQTGGTESNPTYTYQLYLPGNANLEDCYLTWDGDMQFYVDGALYESGRCPIAPVNANKTYYLVSGNKAVASFACVTYVGSASVTPVFIEIDETGGKPTIAQMDSDPNHETACSGTIYIDGTQYGLSKIKGRGNATWYNAEDKLPYNITLDTKIKWPGVDSAKTKKWSLLAEAFDHSLLSNRAGLTLAHEMGIGLGTASADVWMNGEYQGCYTVSPKTDSYVSDNGFMIENDNYAEAPVEQGGDPQFLLYGNSDYEWGEGPLITVKKIGDNLLKDSSGNVDESAANLVAVSGKIQSWLQEAWDAILSDTGYNSKGKYYTDYIDIESFAKMYLMQEYVKSYDVCSGSILMYCDGVGAGDRLYAGPLWDLDNAMGSTSQNYTIGAADDRVNGDRRSGEGDFIPNISEWRASIFKTLLKHGDFVIEVFYQYNRYRNLFNSMAGIVGGLIEEIELSALMNHMKVIEPAADNHRYERDTVLGSGQYYQYYYATTNQLTTWQASATNLLTYATIRSHWFNNRYTAFANGWLEYAGKYYYIQDFYPIENGVVYYKGEYYYIDNYTLVSYGVVKYQGTFLFIDNYRLVKEGWMYYKGGYLYIKDYQPVREGWVVYDGQYYYIRNYYPVTSDWVLDNGTYYYLRSSGNPAVNVWLNIDGTWYHFNRSGVVDRAIAA